MATNTPGYLGGATSAQATPTTTGGATSGGETTTTATATPNRKRGSDVITPPSHPTDKRFDSRPSPSDPGAATSTQPKVPHPFVSEDARKSFAAAAADPTTMAMEDLEASLPKPEAPSKYVYRYVYGHGLTPLVASAWKVFDLHIKSAILAEMAAQRQPVRVKYSEFNPTEGRGIVACLDTESAEWISNQRVEIDGAALTVTDFKGLKQIRRAAFFYPEAEGNPKLEDIPSILVWQNRYPGRCWIVRSTPSGKGQRIVIGCDEQFYCAIQKDNCACILNQSVHLLTPNGPRKTSGKPKTTTSAGQSKDKSKPPAAIGKPQPTPRPPKSWAEVEPKALDRFRVEGGFRVPTGLELASMPERVRHKVRHALMARGYKVPAITLADVKEAQAKGTWVPPIPSRRTAARKQRSQGGDEVGKGDDPRRSGSSPGHPAGGTSSSNEEAPMAVDG